MFYHFPWVATFYFLCFPLWERQKQLKFYFCFKFLKTKVTSFKIGQWTWGSVSKPTFKDPHRYQYHPEFAMFKAISRKGKFLEQLHRHASVRMLHTAAHWIRSLDCWDFPELWICHNSKSGFATISSKSAAAIWVLLRGNIWQKKGANLT